MTLRWHIWHRADKEPAEYAIDDRNRPVFLIMNNTLYEADPHTIDCEGIKLEMIVWNDVWRFDSLWQARREAKIRHATPPELRYIKD